jgi:hypothetical protein
MLIVLSSSAFALTLVKDGKALSAVYVEPAVMAADDRTVERTPGPAREREMQRRTLRESVKDLALYLGKMSGAQVEIVAVEPAPGDGRVPILIGAHAVRAFGEPKERSPWKQGWRMVVMEKAVGLLGESDEATSYAIYEVLDRLGCRWFLPGELGEDIPARSTITLPNLDLSAVPPILGRNIGRMDADFQRRNRCGGLQVQINNLGTSLKTYLPQEELEDHPAWNALIDGKREVTGVYCWSNPEVQAVVADRIITRLDAAYTSSFTLSQPYGRGFCECAECTALDAGDWCELMNEPSKTDRYVWFANRVAERVTKKYPDVLFGILANMNYIDPPVREKPHPNLVPAVVAVNTCRAHSMSEPDCPSRQKLRSIIAGWAKLSPRLVGYEFAYNLAEVGAPYPLLRWVEDIPYLFANNVKFWMPQGWVQDEMKNLESTLPGVYLGMRLAWNPQAKPQDVLNEFYTRCYGKATAPMRRYWETVDGAWQNTAEHAGSHYGFYHRFSPEVTGAARAALNEGLKAARTAAEYRRVKLAEEGFAGFELYMKMRRDLCEGRFEALEDDAARWKAVYRYRTEGYRANAAFPPLTVNFFDWFHTDVYRDAVRIAKENVLLAGPVPAWRFRVDREGRGEAEGWSKNDFDDTAWQQTDPRRETWSDLGLFSYYGSMWYRAKVSVPALPAGKKVYLWVSAVDDTCQVFVNGRPIGEMKDYCKPFAFDITAAVTAGENQVTIKGTRSTLNEVGTGGLLGPVVIYREK